MAQYIEVIEIVEEVAAVIKLEDLKESADIVRELQQSIAASENIDSSNEVSVEGINKKQLQLAQKLQKSLISLQSETFESQQECIPSISEDVRQQIIEVVTELQNDLVVFTGPDKIVEQNLTLSDIKEPYHKENIMSENILVEEQNKSIELVENNNKVCVEEESPIEYKDKEDDLQNKTDTHTVLLLDQSQLIEVAKTESVIATQNEESKETKCHAILTHEVQNVELIKNIAEELQENLTSVDQSTIVTLQDTSKEKIVLIIGT